MVPFRVPLLTIPVDDVAYVWWYDNVGAIQSHGINFVQDLPYFLVLLLCFERFTLSDWGIISEFKLAEPPRPDDNHGLLLLPLSHPHSKVKVKTNHSIRGHFGIVGRGTQMLLADSESNDPREADKSLVGMKLVVKVYWPEASRAGEAEIIEEARNIAKQVDGVNGHIPDLIYSHDFNEYSTKIIREALNIKPKVGDRVLRIMLLRRLDPITDLTGEEFWKAFWECFTCECASGLCCNVLTLMLC
jgi:hypothetical protein